MFDYKVCPECGGEYRLEIQRCADCGVALVFPDAIARRDARELRQGPGQVPLRTASIEEVRALADDLERRGIRYRIDRRRAREEGLLTLYVRQQDRQAAAAVDEARFGSEEPEEVGKPLQEVPSYKVCPRCGGEYRWEVDLCADCGCALVPAGEGVTEGDETEERPEPDYPVEELLFTGPAQELPPSDDLVCICCRSMSQLEWLSRNLDDAEIAHRLEPAPFGEPRVGCLLVLPADADAAAEIDFALGSVPLEDSDLSTELMACPACGAARAPDAVECDACGLVLSPEAAEPTTCARCGSIVWLTAVRCPNCAAELPRQPEGVE